jgi:hypothetical protein
MVLPSGKALIDSVIGDRNSASGADAIALEIDEQLDKRGPTLRDPQHLTWKTFTEQGMRAEIKPPPSPLRRYTLRHRRLLESAYCP